MPEIFDFENEVESIDRAHADFPSNTEIDNMCIDLEIKRDYSRTRNNKDDAWAYYHELKTQIEARQRKTA